MRERLKVRSKVRLKMRLKEREKECTYVVARRDEEPERYNLKGQMSEKEERDKEGKKKR